MIIDEKKVNLAEKDIEQWLWENPTAVQFGRSENVTRWIHRQLHVPSGIVDLIGVTASHGLVVVEVKNTEIKQDALLQVARYAFDVGIISIRAVEAKELWNYPTPPVYKLVVGRSIDFKTARDAEATDIFIMTFAVQMSLFLSGDLRWRGEFVNQREEQYEKIATDDGFRDVAETHASRFKADRNAISFAERSFLLPVYAEHGEETEELMSDEGSTNG